MAKRKTAAYVAVVLVAASLFTFLVEWWLCRWPAPHPLSAPLALFTAVTYVTVAVLSGAVSTWFFWFPSGMTSSVSSSLLTIASAIGWIWIPSVALLSKQNSIFAVPIAALAAGVMASGLHKIVRGAAPASNSLDGQWKRRELFTGYLSPAPREMSGFTITVCFYAGFFALLKQSLYAASFLMALCAFLLTWKLMADTAYASANRDTRLHPLLRLAGSASTAVLITMGLLLLGIQRGSRADRSFSLHKRHTSTSGLLSY